MSDMEQTPGGEIIVYSAEDGSSRIRVLLEDETVWLTQTMMAELYETSIPNINLHIRNILEEKELRAETTIKEYLLVRQEGLRRVRRPVIHYNLDMILAVGCRVRSSRGTQFRQWATERLREYLVKGFTMDDERLKGGHVLKRDVSTAKNYLDAKEIDTLNRITVMFLDQAEFRAQRRQDIRIRGVPQAERRTPCAEFVSCSCD